MIFYVNGALLHLRAAQWLPCAVVNGNLSPSAFGEILCVMPLTSLTRIPAFPRLTSWSLMLIVQILLESLDHCLFIGDSVSDVQGE